MDNAFENFMNLLRRKQHGLDDELSAAAEHGEGQSEAVIGDNHEPASVHARANEYWRMVERSDGP